MFNEIGLRMAILFLFAIKILNLVVGFWNCMICGENYYVQGIPHPALNSVRAEVCVSFGHAGLQMLNELEEQTLLVRKQQNTRDQFNRSRKRNLPKGLVFLVLALIPWGDWIPSEVSVNFPWLLEDKVILCSWKSHLSVRQLINTTTAKTKQKHELHLCFHTSDHQAVLPAAALPPAAASSSRTQLPDTAHESCSHLPCS